MKENGDLIAASKYLRRNYKVDGGKITSVLPSIIARVQNAAWVVWLRSREENSLWRMGYCSMRAGCLKAVKPLSRNDFQDLARQSNTWIDDLMLDTLPLKAQHHTGHLQRFLLTQSCVLTLEWISQAPVQPRGHSVQPVAQGPPVGRSGPSMVILLPSHVFPDAPISDLTYRGLQCFQGKISSFHNFLKFLVAWSDFLLRLLPQW